MMTQSLSSEFSCDLEGEILERKSEEIYFEIHTKSPIKQEVTNVTFEHSVFNVPTSFFLYLVFNSFSSRAFVNPPHRQLR